MSRINDPITPAEDLILDAVAEEYIAVGLSCERADRPVAEEAIRAQYQQEGLGLERPAITWAESPMAAVRRLDADERRYWSQAACYGQHSAAWLAHYEAIRRVMVARDIPEDDDVFAAIAELENFDVIARTCGWWLAYEGEVIACERTSAVREDEVGRLHCETGPAIEYPDGEGCYVWHGVAVPAYVILEPDRITPELISAEQNLELRRVLLDRYGRGRWLEAVGAEVIDEGPAGTLLSTAEGRFVRVVNSTPDADGTRREFVLRVAARVTTAREAVASTFCWGTPIRYRPRIET